MSEHVTERQMKRFVVSALPEPELVVIAKHLSDCETCQELLSETLRRQRGSEGVRFTLAPEFWLKHEHVDYEQLVDIADDKLDATDREIIDIHLDICATCREDVRSFLAFRQELESQLHVRYGPVAQKPQRGRIRLWTWWQGLAWKPAYAAAAITLLAIALATLVLLLKHSTNVFEAGGSPTPQLSPTPALDSDRASVIPSPVPTLPAHESASNSPTPTRPPSPKRTIDNPSPPRDDSHVVVALNDGRSTITVDARANVMGLDDVPSETRREIANALLSGKVETPEIVKELSVPERTLRGPNSGQAFKLLSPGRTVIINDRPSFEWERLPGATSYRVYVGDLKGHEVAKSEELSPDRTSWTPAASVKRGEIYSWAVAAVVDGKEVFSPGAAAPEMKFQILSSHSLQELNQLRKARSHLALGVFYARVGLLTDAEQELQELIRLNPTSTVAINLLRSVQLLRGQE